MKRTGDWKRRVPLTSKTPLVGSSPSMRSSRLTRTVMAKKAPKVTPEERAARKTVKARSQNVCEIHGDHPGTDMHHRLNRSQSGQWSPDNLLHLCHAVHMEITVSPKRAMEQGWTVRSGRNPANVPCWLAGMGFVFLTPEGDITDIEDEEVA
jgi:hypothetical protein